MKRCVVWVLSLLLLSVFCGESFARTCTNCGGTGKIKCSTCGGWGWRGNIRTKCYSCKGKGNKGTCSRCGGKGYIPDSNPSSGGDGGGGNNDSIIAAINVTNFPDDVFREYVTSNFDNDRDGYLRTSEIASTTSINVNDKGISSLKGIKYFTALTELDCGQNQLTELDISYNTALTTLWCDNNQLTYIDITGCKSLKTFLHDDSVQIIDKSKIAEINAQNFPDYGFRDYVRSYFDENKNNYLDVWEIADATTINVNGMGISSLKGIEYFTALTELYCSSNKLTALDVSKNIALRTLYCSSNKLTALDVSKNTALRTLYCSSNQLKTLDVSKNTSLTELICGSVHTGSTIFGDEYHYKDPSSYNSNQLTTLDVSNNIALKCLDCSSNHIKTLDVSNNTALTELWCYNNELTSLILGLKPALTSLHCDGNKLTHLDVLRCPALTTENFIYDEEVNIIDIIINEINFPDDVFREYVSSHFDEDSDGLLSKAEISEAIYINVNNKGISSLQGVEYFTSLKLLSCYGNNLTALDVSDCISLEELDCSNNQLIVLDVSGCTALWSLDCSNNQLVALVVPNKYEYSKLSSYGSALASHILDIGTGKFYLYVRNDDGVLILDRYTTLTISPSTLTDGKAGTNYTAKLSANPVNNSAADILARLSLNSPTDELLSENLSGVTWSATNLPSWLKLYASTGELYGTPTTGGSYTFTVTASLSSLSAQKTYTLTISSGSGTGTDEDDVVISTPKFKSANLTLTGEIAVNFFIDLPEIPGVNYYDGKTCYTDFNIKGNTTSNTPQPVDGEFMNNGNYGFKCYVTSIQMADPITATFHYGNGETVQQAYSVKQYLDNRINKTTSATMKNLAVAIKNYGHYAQIYLDRVNDSWELGKDHVAFEAASDYSAEDIAGVKSLVAPYRTNADSFSGSGIKKGSYNLNLDSETTINFTFTMDADYTGDFHAYLNGGTKDLAVKQSDGTYKVQISNIAAHELADTQTVKISAGKELTIKASGLTFVYNSLYGSYPEDRQKAAVAFYKYYEATTAYRNAK